MSEGKKIEQTECASVSKNTVQNFVKITLTNGTKAYIISRHDYEEGNTMYLGLSQIINNPGKSISFSERVDLSDLQYGTSFPVSEPVCISATVRNTADVLVMQGNITTRLHGVCDRCAGEFTRDVDIPVDVVLVKELVNEENEDEGVFPLCADAADLDEIVRTVFVLNMDSKLLCKPDCKGLCCRCGKNLNEGPCDCQKEPDPRFAALRQLLDK